MVGRPRLNDEVAVMTLRLSPTLLARVNRCKALIELQEGSSPSRTQVLWRIIEEGCKAVEGQVQAPQTSMIPEIPQVPQVTEIPDVDQTQAPTVQEMPPEAPSHPGPLGESEPEARTAPRTQSHRGTPRETLEAIAEERTHCEGLSYREFAQRLYDKGIYRQQTKDGQTVPVDPGNLSRWLKRASKEGLL
jgi:hypothetical protein